MKSKAHQKSRENCNCPQNHMEIWSFTETSVNTLFSVDIEVYLGKYILNNNP